MNNEIDWYRTPPDAKDEGVSGVAERAIRWNSEKGKYFLVSGRRNPGVSGDITITQIEFEDPKILKDAIVTLSIRNATYLRGTGTVTTTYGAWDHSQASPHDFDAPDDIQTGEVSLSLSIKDNVLAPFESTVQIQYESGTK